MRTPFRWSFFVVKIPQKRTNYTPSPYCGVSYGHSMNIVNATKEDGEELADLRSRAMRESLENVGRFDPIRVRHRFLSKFDPENTKKIIIGDSLIGFYVVLDKSDHYYLDHLYIDLGHQGKNYGSEVLLGIIRMAQGKGMAIRLGALKGSRSNQFYQSHGFVKTHEEEFDIFYIYQHS